MREIPTRHIAQERLLRLFPREAFDTVLANPLSASAAVAMIYVDAVIPDQGDVDDHQIWARPTTCLWLSDEALVRTDDADRIAWRNAAAGAKAKKRLAELLEAWGEQFLPWYADNTRETLRDETFRKWLDFGAVRDRPGVKTTSGVPRWALTASFADLFDPALVESALDLAITAWRESHMRPGDLLRIRTARDRDRESHAVSVTLPDAKVISLEPGGASEIVKGVIEKWARDRLIDPVVLSISEPGAKSYMAGASTMSAVGLSINVSTLLPDVLLLDLGTPQATFWIIEAVESDGPIDEDRRRAFLRWAEDHRIPPDSIRFLSAFRSRGSESARRRLKDLAVGTYAWYLDEPGHELAWYGINSDIPTDGPDATQ